MQHNQLFRKVLLTLFTIILSQQLSAAGSDDFIFQVITDLPGPSADTEFLIRTNPSLTYKYNVDCDNDTNFEGLGVTGDFLCIYQGPDEYTIRIEDDMGDGTGFPRVYFNNVGDQNKIIDIVQWGTGIWTNMESAFHGAVNMHVTASDVPDLSQVSNANAMFLNASLANPNTTNWDVSNIDSMSSMFRNAFSATPDTGTWNTSNVTNMFSMFKFATSANPNTSLWITSNVENMGSMFANATAATPDISGWDISSITTLSNSMNNMFMGITLPTALYDDTLTNFDGQITVSGIVFDGGNSKYCNVSAHDSLINTHGWTITDGGLDPSCSGTPADDFVIEVNTNIAGSTNPLQFTIPTNSSGGVVYNYNVDCDDNNPGTNTATAQTGDYTCLYTTAGIYTIRISDNVGDKTGFPRIFFNGVGDNKKIIDLKQWGTGIWTNMESAFSAAINMVVSATDNPDLSQVTNVSSMFFFAGLANPNTTNWDVSNIEMMQNMFRSTASANPDVSLWNTTNVISMSSMFSGTTSANPDVSLWNTTNVISMSSMFRGATSANPDVSLWNTSNVTNMTRMYSGATLANPDVSLWNTVNVVNMATMFSGATSATPDMSTWNITGITVPFSMENMLNGLTLPTSLYDATLANFNSQVTANGIVFDGGNSKYCNVAARDNLINTHGWTITDGGLDSNCPVDDIFSNGFEDVIIFKAAQSQFNYDFSEVSINDMDEEPLLIAQGVDEQHKPVIHIYLRNDVGQLQIRLDKLDKLNANDIENIQWIQGQWQSIDNKELTTISW